MQSKAYNRNFLFLGNLICNCLWICRSQFWFKLLVGCHSNALLRALSLLLDFRRQRISLSHIKSIIIRQYKLFLIETDLIHLGFDCEVLNESNLKSNCFRMNGSSTKFLLQTYFYWDINLLSDRKNIVQNLLHSGKRWQHL